MALPVIKLVEEERARAEGAGMALAGKENMTRSRPQLTALLSWGGNRSRPEQGQAWRSGDVSFQHGWGRRPLHKTENTVGKCGDCCAAEDILEGRAGQRVLTVLPALCFACCRVLLMVPLIEL